MSSAELSAAGLIAAFAVTEPTFSVTLRKVDSATGKVQEFPVSVRMISKVSDLAAIKLRAKQFARMMAKNPPPELAAYQADCTEQVAEIVCTIADLVLSPKFTDAQALQLTRDAGPLATNLHQQIMARVGMASGAAEAEALEAYQDFLAQEKAPSGETTSPSPATSTENIPTN